MQASYHVVDVLYRALNEAGKCINGSKILILGVAYKKDISDIRVPALKIMSCCATEGRSFLSRSPYLI